MRNKPESSLSGYLTVTDVMNGTGFTNSYIIRLIHQGRLEATRVGPIWLVTHDSVQEFMSQPRKPTGRPPKNA